MNEAGTKGGEHNLVALLEQMLIVPKGQWNGGGTGVAIMVDIDHHAVEIELGTFGYSLDDAEVGLVRYNPIDILALEVVALEYLQHVVAHVGYRIAEHGASLLVEVVQTVIYGEMRSGAH